MRIDVASRVLAEIDKITDGDSYLIRVYMRSGTVFRDVACGDIERGMWRLEPPRIGSAPIWVSVGDVEAIEFVAE